VARRELGHEAFSLKVAGPRSRLGLKCAAGHRPRSNRSMSSCVRDGLWPWPCAMWLWWWADAHCDPVRWD